MPFDRLVRAVDAWCALRGPEGGVFGQIGDPGPRGYRPEHFAWEPFLAPREFSRHIEACDLVVAHAGMGSIISALSHAKPILILPRRVELGEHRNDHQLATAERFGTHAGVWVARDESDVADRIDELLASRSEPGACTHLEPYAETRLIAALRRFVRGETEG